MTLPSPIFYNYNQELFESKQPFYYYDKEIGNVQVLDANTWINCLTKFSDYWSRYWTPDVDFSLMQLVKKELVLGSEYLDSCHQYIIYSDNTYGGYQGDYTEDDHKKFRNS